MSGLTVGDLRRILEGYRDDLPVSLDVGESWHWTRRTGHLPSTAVALSCEHEGDLVGIIWRRLPDGALIVEERDLYDDAVSRGLIEDAFGEGDDGETLIELA